MGEKIGVYVCHCGSNIAGVVDVEEVARWAKEKFPDVTVSRDYKFMCSSPGQELIESDIKEFGLTRDVVAACSPHLHEKTFRGACSRAGLNPFLFEMASIREHVAWVTKDKVEATIKSKALVDGAVRRVTFHEPLDPIRVDITPTTLVVGGGVAGIQAALEIADSGTQVILVEREPSIGGHMAQFDKTFPTRDCSACILTPKMFDVGNDPNITMLTYSEVESVDGYVGNFEIKVRKKARMVEEDLCTGCLVCQEKCPKRVVDDVFEVGMAKRKAIYVPFPQAVPNVVSLDARCRSGQMRAAGACVGGCTVDCSQCRECPIAYCVKACEKEGIKADFYIKTFHSHNYPTAPKPEEIKGAYNEFPGYWCSNPEETAAFMKTVNKPWIAFKVMAAGAIPPQNAFKYAFDSGADFVLAGMFDYEVAEDVKIAKEVLAAVTTRERPWRA